MTIVYDMSKNDGRGSESIWTGEVVWEGLRRGILQQVKIVTIRTTMQELEELREEMASSTVQSAVDMMAYNTSAPTRDEMANPEAPDDSYEHELDETAALEGGDVPDEDEVK